MNDEKKQSFWTTIPGILTGLAAVISAVATLYIALNKDPSQPQIIQKPPGVTSQLPPKQVPSAKVRKYLMDKQPNRIIVITHLQQNKYRIEEPSSPWPWEGDATIDGGQLIGEAKFRNSLATMRVKGVARGDESIVVKYKFITCSDGKPSTGRIDDHIWYPAN
jgi:hypothetical protein